MKLLVGLILSAFVIQVRLKHTSRMCGSDYAINLSFLHVKQIWIRSIGEISNHNPLHLIVSFNGMLPRSHSLISSHSRFSR